MNQLLSKSPGKFVLYLILLFLTACAQQPRKTDIAAGPENPENSSFLDRIFSSDPGPDSTQFQSREDHDDLWARLFSLYALPYIDNPRIDHEMERYTRNPRNLETIMARAEPYLYAIVEEIDAKNMPGELALLPVIESAFKPHAYSRSHAAGIWQFIPATGRFFGLKQNWWYDGRRDIYSSTRVATNYLKELHELFDDDWLLALASYNAGKGTVGKAIARNKRQNKATDYWSLSLSRETMDYVPRLLAVARILANAEKYNIRLRPIANQPTFQVVDIKGQIDLAKAAQMAEISLPELRKYNPGFHQWSTDPDGPHRLLIPVNKVEVFEQNLAKIPEDEWVTWQRHKIRPGENLGLIARRYGTSVAAIRRVNKLPNNTIHAGRHLLIPAPAVKGTYTAKIIPRNSAEDHLVYTVKPGDSYWRIGRQHAVNGAQIANWNRLSLNAPLKPGQKLVIKGVQRPKADTAGQSNTPFQTDHYTVKKGDSLARISRKFNVTITDLRKWNSDSLGKHIHPGQKLKIKAEQEQPAT